LTQTDPRPKHLDDILARIDALVSPIAIEEAHRLEVERLELFRKRIEHTLIDLDLGPASGIIVVPMDGSIAIRTKNRRAAELLLRVLDYHADHHRWRSTW
jgi:hypothetical protein